MIANESAQRNPVDIGEFYRQRGRCRYRRDNLQPGPHGLGDHFITHSTRNERTATGKIEPLQQSLANHLVQCVMTSKIFGHGKHIHPLIEQDGSMRTAGMSKNTLPVLQLRPGLGQILHGRPKEIGARRATR